MATGEIIGRVCFLNRGTYNSSTAYSQLDVVRYGGKSFVAKQATTNHTPTGDSADNYWQLLASTGSYTPTLNNNGILI